MDMKNLFAPLGVEFMQMHRLQLAKVAAGESGNWDQLRLYKYQKTASEVQKKRRKYKAREKVAAEETTIAEEGPTYGPSVLNSNIEP